MRRHGADDTAAKAIKRIMRADAAAVTDHQKARGAGSVPGGLARWAQQTLHPKVNWRQQLASALRLSVHHKAGIADYTWQRPSRRQQPQDTVLRPAMTRPVPSIAVVVDTSGSMSEHDELDRALTEISAIIATIVPGDSVRVLSVDTIVHTDQHIHNTSQISQISLAGAGGTNMAAGIAAAAEAKPDAIVVITDGWTHPCRVDPPQVGNFSDQNWGISVIAVTDPPDPPNQPHQHLEAVKSTRCDGLVREYRHAA